VDPLGFTDFGDGFSFKEVKAQDAHLVLRAAVTAGLFVHGYGSFLRFCPVAYPNQPFRSFRLRQNNEVGCDEAKRSAEPFPPNASAASGRGLGAAPPINLVGLRALVAVNLASSLLFQKGGLASFDGQSAIRRPVFT
jgi:hypothetical protein